MWGAAAVGAEFEAAAGVAASGSAAAAAFFASAFRLLDAADLHLMLASACVAPCALALRGDAAAIAAASSPPFSSADACCSTLSFLTVAGA